VRPEPLHEAPCQNVPIGILGVRRAIEIGVGHRGEQHLTGDLRPAGIASGLTGDRHQVRAGAPASQHQWTGPRTERFGVLGRPLHRSPGVVGRSGKRMLGSVTVIDRENRGAGPNAQVTAEWVVGHFASKHPATTVEVDGKRMRARSVRPV